MKLSGKTFLFLVGVIVVAGLVSGIVYAVAGGMMAKITGKATVPANGEAVEQD